jgi:hypothetical protein
MSEMMPIERGIPIPARAPRGGSGGAGRVKIYPFAELGIGDSFAVPQAKLNSIKVLIHRQHKQTKRRFAWRRIDGGLIRVWREK